MLIGELLYFAPGVTFDEIDFSGDKLPEQYEKRMRGFYLEPALACADSGFGFAAGVLLLSCIDALARTATYSAGGRGRFETFAREQLTSFGQQDWAHRLYDVFRNGLVHEGRIKSGAQFSLETDATVSELQGVFVINPVLLAREVENALNVYIAKLSASKEQRGLLAQFLSRDHEKDLR